MAIKLFSDFLRINSSRLKGLRLLGAALALIMVLPASGQALAEKNFLWQLDFSDGRQAFIMGSIHLANADLYPINSRINAVFDRASALVVEINTENLAPGEMESFIASHGLCLGCKPLKERLRPQTVAALDQSGLYGPHLDAMQPWLAALVIQVKALNRQGFAAEYGLDRYFLGRAQDRQIKIFDLETLNDQMGMLADMSPEESDLFLLSTLLEMNNLPKVMNTFLKAWRDGDVPGFTGAFMAEYDKYPELRPVMDKVIIRRNETMAVKIRQLAARENGPLFIVVGAGHLVGEESILTELAKNGCTATQL